MIVDSRICGTFCGVSVGTIKCHRAQVENPLSGGI